MNPTVHPAAENSIRRNTLGGIDGAILDAADAAKAKMKALTAAMSDQEGGWTNTLSSAAMGVAGAATAVGLSALAFYAYQKFGSDVSLVVAPGSINGIGGYGAEHIKAAVSGLGQIDAFMSGVRDGADASGTGQPTMGDLFSQLQRSGVDPEVFKSAVANHMDLLGVKNAAEWTARLSDPSTPLTPSVQARVTELVWYHDKQAALHAENAVDATVFVKAGFAMAAASASSSLATGAGHLKAFMSRMKAVARRTAVDCGLIDESTDRQVRKIIKETAFDPMEARARLASEYAERQTPMNRFLTMHWIEAAKSADRVAMLQLFGIESQSVSKHTALGQAVMLDHFCAKELRALAHDEPDHSTALSALAERRSKLEVRGVRPKEPIDAFGEFFPDLPIRSIADMVLEHKAVAGTSARRPSGAQARG